MKVKGRITRGICGLFLMVFFCVTVETPAMAGSASTEAETSGVQLYRQVNQSVLKEKGGERFTIGSEIEIDLPSNADNGFNDETSNAELAGNGPAFRQADLFLKYDKIGKLSFGQGETASQILSQIDLSGTDLTGYYGGKDQGSSIFFYDTNFSRLSDSAGGDMMGYLNGNRRKDRFRYDTPRFLGWGVAISTFADQDQDLKNTPAYDAALSYSGSAGDIDMAAAIGYAAHPSDPENGDANVVNGSASVAYSGFSITLAAGNEQHSDGGYESKKFYYGKLGYAMEFWQIGQTALVIDYGKYSEVSQEEDKAKTMGIMFVQKIQDWSSEIYAGFRTQDMEHEGAEYDAVNALTVGTRINF
jgi:hypothetical protein